MSAVEPQKVVETPAAGTTEAAPAPVEPVTVDQPVEPAVEAPKAEEVKPEAEAAVAAPVEEKKDEKPEVKAVEPIYSGALGYKAPGLKNAFRFSKKYFWFGEEAVPASNLREYLRGEKPEIAHAVAAWSSQTGKGLLYFVKHADQKEHPAGALNLAYATDLTKDGVDSFHFKISGHKHAFEAQSAAERDGWFVAVEKAIADAKEAKEGIESSEGYKEQKDKIGKPVPLAAATASGSTPKKSIDATPKLAEAEGAATEEPVAAAPARAGSSSSSSSDEEKKAKKAKSKSRSVSRGKRASIFGGLLGKKDKAEEKVEQKKAEHKEEEAVKAEPEVKKDEAAVAAPAEVTTAAPVITSDIPKVDEEVKADATPAPVEEAKTEETPVKAAEEKPKPSKRGSIFGSVFAKLSSPTHEKKEHDLTPVSPAAAKEAETAPEASKPVEEAQVAAPATTEAATEPVAVKAEEPKPVETKPAVSTPSKEKEHFSFGKLFGSKDRAKSPAATDKVAEPTKVDAVAPQIEDPAAPAASETVTAAAPVEAKAEPVAPVEEKKEETTPVKKEKKSSIFGSLGRTLSKATNKNKDAPKEKKEAVAPAPVAEESTETPAAPVVEEKKEETPAAPAPAEKTIGDVVPEAVTVGEAPKSTPAVASTA